MTRTRRMLGAICVIASLACDIASAAESPKTPGQADRGVVEQAGEAVQNVGKKIEREVKGAAKKFEEQRVGERLGEVLKNAATKTGEELEKAGKKIKETFSTSP